MATWTRNEVAIFARSAGWKGAADDASWVAMAESSGNDKTVNSIGCVGLMQINQPVHVGSHPKWSVKWLQDPINNMSAALVLYKAAGNSFDQAWADSKTKGGIPGGWGPHVKGGGGGGGATQIGDDPCAGFILPGLGKDNPAYKDCTKKGGDTSGGGNGLGDALGLGGIADVASQLGRLAQALAKSGNWLSEPKNWLRIAYVAGGAALGITAVAVIIRPYTAGAYRQIYGALPVKSVRDMARQRNTTTITHEQKEQPSD